MDLSLSLSLSSQHNRTTNYSVCVADGTLLPTRLDRLMIEACLDILLIIHLSRWFVGVEWVFIIYGCVVPFQVTKRNEVGPRCNLLFVDQWIRMCVYVHLYKTRSSNRLNSGPSSRVHGSTKTRVGTTMPSSSEKIHQNTMTGRLNSCSFQYPCCSGECFSEAVVISYSVHKGQSAHRQSHRALRSR